MYDMAADIRMLTILTGDGNWEETEPAESWMIACSSIG